MGLIVRQYTHKGNLSAKLVKRRASVLLRLPRSNRFRIQAQKSNATSTERRTFVCIEKYRCRKNSTLYNWPRQDVLRIIHNLCGSQRNITDCCALCMSLAVFNGAVAVAIDVK